MKKIFYPIALVFLLGLALTLGGCGWYGFGHHHGWSHHYSQGYQEDIHVV